MLKSPIARPTSPRRRLASLFDSYCAFSDCRCVRCIAEFYQWATAIIDPPPHRTPRKRRAPCMSAPSATLRQDSTIIGLIALAHGASHFFQLLLPPLFPLLKVD